MPNSLKCRQVLIANKRFGYVILPAVGVMPSCRQKGLSGFMIATRTGATVPAIQIFRCLTAPWYQPINRWERSARRYNTLEDQAEFDVQQYEHGSPKLNKLARLAGQGTPPSPPQTEPNLSGLAG
jgi:hypothetical protein